MPQSLIGYSNILEISGDIVRVQVDQNGSKDAMKVRLGDLAEIKQSMRRRQLGQVIRIQNNVVSIQVIKGTKGLSTGATISFIGHPMRTSYSPNILGRIFSGAGDPIDNGPDLSADPTIPIDSQPVNPCKRIVPKKMIHTEIPMIDMFNCLVESQKIPIFAASGEPYNAFLARIGKQADADIVVFGGMGLIFDDYYMFRQQFEDTGVFSRTVMFVNLASDPIVERLLTVDMALAVAERFAVEEGKRVLVLLTDMTAFADAMKEIGISMEQVPSSRGYMGDLYSKLAKRYEKACDFSKGGSLTILSVTTMPGNDVTHPVPDNTGYITEGQFYLREGHLDPFGSLSRLKQNVIGKVTREDHNQLMNTMIRFYANSREAMKKQAMAFELSEFDKNLIKFGELFKKRFMDIQISLPLEKALDLGWETLADCFAPNELLMKQSLIDKYYPTQKS